MRLLLLVSSRVTPAAWLMLSLADPLTETRRSDVVQAATAADGAAALAASVAEVPDVAGARADVADPAAWRPGLAVRPPAAVPPPGPQPVSAVPASTVPAASMSHGFPVMVVSPRSVNLRHLLRRRDAVPGSVLRAAGRHAAPPVQPLPRPSRPLRRGCHIHVVPATWLGH